MSLGDDEHTYLAGQRLGRLATLGPDGAPQNRPVGFQVDRRQGTIDIGGWNMSASQKYRNVQREPRVSLVVDDIASLDPWRVRGIEIRGHGETLPAPAQSRFGGQIIRIHPTRVRSWDITS